MATLRCRFYENQYPVNEEVVKVMVMNIQPMGAYVKLLEYDEIEGMILMSELSRRRIRSVNKLIRRGRTEIVVVLRTDSKKGYIDLSKRRVNSEDMAKCEEKYSNAKTVNQILRHTAELLNYESSEQLVELYQKTAWHFDRKLGKPGASYEIFRKAVETPNIFDECNLDEKTSEMLISEIKRRLMPQAVKIRSDFEVSCFNYEGIDAIKRAIRKGLAFSTPELELQIHLIAPPTFFIATQTMDRNAGMEVMNKALDAISESILAEGGRYTLVFAPKVVSDSEETLLKNRLAELEAANQEVSGDDSDSDLDSSGDEEDSDEEEEKDESEETAK